MASACRASNRRGTIRLTAAHAVGRRRNAERDSFTVESFSRPLPATPTKFMNNHNGQRSVYFGHSADGEKMGGEWMDNFVCKTEANIPSKINKTVC